MSLPRAFNILYADNGFLRKDWHAFEADELVAWQKTTNTYGSLKLKSTTVSYSAAPRPHAHLRVCVPYSIRAICGRSHGDIRGPLKWPKSGAVRELRTLQP